MSSALFAPVCAIAATRRRRFMWAAWWARAPTRSPFSKPDAFAGGARTRAEALAAAERAAGRTLTVIDSSWARAWAKVLVGEAPWPATDASQSGDAVARPRSNAQPELSLWQTLGLRSGATLVEIKRAYRQRALETHPDRGGSDAAFRAVQAAYESALKRHKRAPKAR